MEEPAKNCIRLAHYVICDHNSRIIYRSESLPEYFNGERWVLFPKVEIDISDAEIPKSASKESVEYALEQYNKIENK